MDVRLAALKTWLGGVLDAPVLNLRPASTDASFRRYFRIEAGGRTLIAMDAPPERENCARFVAVARRFAALGLHVPEVLAEDLAQGFLLLTDLGERPYLPALNNATVERLYGDALGALVTLQAGIVTEAADTGDFRLPDYDEALLTRELGLFREWYLERHLGRVLAASQIARLEHAGGLLVRSALEQPRVWVHRDYHSRNLMITPTNNPGILDFQDAVRGPITYDPVSLLRDCYIAWPLARVREWALGYLDLARRSGLTDCNDEALFLRWFDWMGMQRHLKAVGIFARLNHRDGKPGYLGDIPRTLGYVREVGGRYRELADFMALLDELGVPA
jgi:hypothetical protein